MKTKIIVASHKPYMMPSDPMYLPIFVGSAGKDEIEGFQRDDVGVNISEKNPKYSELTGVYWAWKNLDVDNIGLAHYRRHFAGNGEYGTLTSEEANALLELAPVVLPKKRNYYIDSVGDHYGHTFDPKHLSLLRSTIVEYSPKYVDAFDEHLKERSSHIWNMSIMHRDIYEEWCKWLFDILFELETKIDFSNMSNFEMRVMGRLSERLIDPWLKVNQIDYVENPVVSMEKTNWIKKGSSFMAAKFFGKKYSDSF